MQGIGELFLRNIAALTIPLIFAACWVLAYTGRAERLALIIRAIRGAPSEPTPENAPGRGTPAAPSRAVGGHWRALVNALRRGDHEA